MVLNLAPPWRCSRGLQFDQLRGGVDGGEENWYSAGSSSRCSVSPTSETDVEQALAGSEGDSSSE